jgi:hypothetical protein
MSLDINGLGDKAFLFRSRRLLHSDRICFEVGSMNLEASTDK